MFLSANALIGYDVLATDEKVGSIEDIYFDDNEWIVRYLVDKTGFLFFGKKVLIPLLELDSIDSNKKNVKLKITKEEVMNSPTIDQDEPVSRDKEKLILGYYAFQPYWNVGSGFMGGGIGNAGSGYMGSAAGFGGLKSRREIVKDSEEDEENSLRSVTEMVGYKMGIKEDEIGEVADLILDENHEIAFIAVKTDKLECRDYMLVLPEWIHYISYRGKVFSTNKPKAYFENCPEYNLGDTVPDEYRKVLEEFYGEK